MKGHLVVYLQSQGKLAVEYFAFGNTGPSSKKFDALSPFLVLFLFKDVALMNHWVKAWNTLPSVSEMRVLVQKEKPKVNDALELLRMWTRRQWLL